MSESIKKRYAHFNKSGPDQSTFDVVHWGEVEESHNISTGQPELETFELDDRDSWVARALELGVTPEQIDPESDELELPPPPESAEPDDEPSSE
jgi:hypothetical protein